VSLSKYREAKRLAREAQEKPAHKGKCTVVLDQIYDVSIDDFRDVTQEDWDACYKAASSKHYQLQAIAEIVKGITPTSEIEKWPYTTSSKT
jgi:hypothetical protein